MPHKAAFIVNPHAANGAVGRKWAHIRALAHNRLGPFHSFLTAGRGDATRFTRHAILDGRDQIICVGGDGTFNEVVNGFMTDGGPLRQGVSLGFISHGTGCDFARTVPLPKDLNQVMELIRSSTIRPIDLGRIKYLDWQGKSATRFFHNITSFGISGEVAARVNRTSRIFGGFASFMCATIVSVLLYKHKVVHLTLDQGSTRKVPIWNIAIANGQYHGGGMRVAPHAAVDDGLFHITVIGAFSLPETFRHLPKLYNGKLLRLDKVWSYTGKRIEASSDQSVLVELDGEQPGRLPVLIELLPRAFQLIAPPG